MHVQEVGGLEGEPEAGGVWVICSSSEGTLRLFFFPRADNTANKMQQLHGVVMCQQAGCLKSVRQDSWLAWSSSLGSVRVVCQQAGECSMLSQSGASKRSAALLMAHWSVAVQGCI